MLSMMLILAKESKADSVRSALAQLDAILELKSEMNKGVYKYTIGRPDVMLKEHGIPVTGFAVFNTWGAGIELLRRQL